MNYNIYFDICGVVILLLVLLILNKFYVVKSESSKLFRKFLIIAIISGTLDIATAFTISYSKTVPDTLNLLLNTVYLFIGTYTTYSSAVYIYSTIKLKKSFHKIYNTVIIGIYALLLFVNLFTGFLFSFKNHEYVHGPLYYIVFIQSFFLIFYFIGVMIFEHSAFTKKQLFIYSSFIISPAICVVVQVYSPEILMTVFSSATVALLMLCGVETPDFVELEYLKKNLENEVAARTRELKKANKILKEKNDQNKMDMEMASHLQKTLFLNNVSFLGWDVALKFLPVSGISGDLYDFYMSEGLLRGIGLFDVSGHGIAAGLVTVLAKNSIMHEFRTTLPLNMTETMNRINDAVIRAKGGIDNFLTGIVCRFDKEDPSKFEFANAGAPYPIYKAKNKKESVLLMPNKKKPQYGMIGCEGLKVCFQTIKRKLNIGDTLVLYTDGLIESENTKREQYGMERVQNVINTVNGTSQEIADAIIDDLKSFMGENEIDDDITIIVLKRVEDGNILNGVEELEPI